MFTLHRAATSAVAAVAILTAAAASAQTPAPQPTPVVGHADVFVPDTRRLAFVSKVNGHAYSIDVAWPETPPPPGGYPVIYVLDGNVYFASVVGAVRANGNAPQAMVVGVGYPAADPAWRATYLAKMKVVPPGLSPVQAAGMAISMARIYDLTSAADADSLKQAVASGVTATAADFGGVDDFLKTIETEVKPRVQALAVENHASVNLHDQTLFGHSLGGLAVVDALFTEPGAYRTFVAASPSIWFADRAVLAKEAAFDAAVTAGKAAPRVLITVGADEEAIPKLPPEMAIQRAAIEASVKKAHMVGNACDLATRLQALHGGPGYEVADCAVFPHQEHGISVWPAIGRAVSFAYPH